MAQVFDQANSTTDEPVPPEEILNVVEVCRLLRVGKSEIYRAVHEGRLPVMRFGKAGRTWRFSKVDILKLSRCDAKGYTK